MSQHSPKKVMVIFGTRPEATKMAPIVLALKKYPEWFETLVVVTGQHREQLYQALETFGLSPDIDLQVMKEQQSLTYVSTAVLNGLDKIFRENPTDFVLVHGDTQTAAFGALSAFFHQIPTGHVEAGLRSYNIYSPFPEEINRKVADLVSNIMFAPTKLSKSNLLKEAYPEEQIYVTGQTSVDAALATYREEYVYHNQALNGLIHEGQRLVVVTAHRRENYGEPMQNMFTAIRRIVEENSDVVLVYPVHLSPKVRETAYQILGNHDRILLLDPLDYPDMINLMARSSLILSDSGGLQEESSVFGVPLILMRETTERPEAVEANTVVLAGTSEENVYAIATRLLTDKKTYNNMANAKNPFGDGTASERIAKILACHFGFLSAPPEDIDS